MYVICFNFGAMTNATPLALLGIRAVLWAEQVVRSHRALRGGPAANGLNNFCTFAFADMDRIAFMSWFSLVNHS